MDLLMSTSWLEVCFYVLGRAALILCLGVVWPNVCSRCSVGSGGTVSPFTQAGSLRCTLRVG